MTIERAQEIFNLDLTTMSASELRARWHDLLRQHHPDLGEPSEAEVRTEMTLRINAAYRLLELVLEERDGNSPPDPFDPGADWSFSAEQPDWWPKEPYKRRSRRSRKSSMGNNDMRPSAPGVGRQRVLFGGVTIWLLSSRVDPLTTLGSLILLAIVLSLYEGRIAPIVGDVLRPVERLVNRR